MPKKKKEDQTEFIQPKFAQKTDQHSYNVVDKFRDLILKPGEHSFYFDKEKTGPYLFELLERLQIRRDYHDNLRMSSDPQDKEFAERLIEEDSPLVVSSDFYEEAVQEQLDLITKYLMIYYYWHSPQAQALFQREQEKTSPLIVSSPLTKVTYEDIENIIKSLKKEFKKIEEIHKNLKGDSRATEKVIDALRLGTKTVLDFKEKIIDIYRFLVNAGFNLNVGKEIKGYGKNKSLFVDAGTHFLEREGIKIESIFNYKASKEVIKFLRAGNWFLNSIYDWRFKYVLDPNDQRYNLDYIALTGQPEMEVRQYQIFFDDEFPEKKKFFSKFIKAFREWGKSVTFEESYKNEIIPISGYNVTFILEGFQRTEKKSKNVLNFLNRDNRINIYDNLELIKKKGFSASYEGSKIIVKFSESEENWLGKGLKTVRGKTRKLGTGGYYSISNDTVHVYHKMFRSSYIYELLTHELGHRFYYKKLPPQAKAYWKDILEKRKKTLDKKIIRNFFNKYMKNKYYRDVPYSKEDSLEIIEQEKKEGTSFDIIAAYAFMANQWVKFFQYWDQDNPKKMLRWMYNLFEGQTYDQEFISAYGAFNEREAFAEAFAFYIVFGPGFLGPWTREYFKRISETGGIRVKNITKREK